MLRPLGTLLLILLPLACSHVGAGPVVTFEYEFDLAAAEADGWITSDELASPGELLEQTMGVLKHRLDPQGTMDPQFRIVGNRIVVEIPESKSHKHVTLDAGQRRELQFLMAAKATDLPAGTDLTAELDRAQAWLAANLNGSLSQYNALSQGDGGPWRGADGSSIQIAQHLDRELVALKREGEARWQFNGSDFSSIDPSSDSFGCPAIVFMFSPAKKADFEVWTGKHIDELLAIVVDDRVLAMSNIESPLPGAGVINGGVGGFDPDELHDLIVQLRSGMLRLPLVPVVR